MALEILLAINLIPPPALAQCPPGWTAGALGRIKYQYWTPKDYNPAIKYPLVTVFHGAGGISPNNTSCYEIECAVLTEDTNLSKRPCFILAPKCTTFEDRWVTIHYTGDTLYSIDEVPMAESLKDAMKVMDMLIGNFSIDTTRLYLMGASLGAYVQWDLMTRFPRKFAAAIPTSGGCDTSKAMLIRHIPVRIAHSTNDATVPIGGSRAMYAALCRAGGHPLYKEYIDYGHLWDFELAEGRSLIPWFFEQSIKYDTTPPSSPANPDASYSTHLGVSLHWDPVEDAESGLLSYRVFRDGEWLQTVYAPGCNDSAAQPNTNYTYAITAVNKAGLESADSSTIQIHTGTGVVADRYMPDRVWKTLRSPIHISIMQHMKNGNMVIIRKSTMAYDIAGRKIEWKYAHP